MKSVFQIADNAAHLVPDPVRPLTKPFDPLGRRLRNTAYHLLPERTTTTPWGVTIRVDDSVHVERTLADGRFEHDFISYVRSQIEDWSQFVDVGANIGFFGLLVQQDQPDCHVDAFEPLPRNVARILTNEALNGGDMDIHAVALADSFDTATLNVSDDLPGETSISESLRSGHVNRTITVATAPLDAVLESAPDAMKIDIEGAEIQMLRGATDILDSTPELFIELHPSNIEAMGESLSHLVELLSAAGYQSARWISTGEDKPLDTLTRVDAEHQHFHVR